MSDKSHLRAVVSPVISFNITLGFSRDVDSTVGLLCCAAAEPRGGSVGS